MLSVGMRVLGLMFPMILLMLDQMSLVEVRCVILLHVFIQASFLAVLMALMYSSCMVLYLLLRKSLLLLRLCALSACFRFIFSVSNVLFHQGVVGSLGLCL